MSVLACTIGSHEILGHIPYQDVYIWLSVCNSPKLPLPTSSRESGTDTALTLALTLALRDE